MHQHRFRKKRKKTDKKNNKPNKMKRPMREKTEENVVILYFNTVDADDCFGKAVTRTKKNMLLSLLASR